jgi:EAL domain-containing protein (putative c-di-GMP-specific phosphodiesterase class I)
VTSALDRCQTDPATVILEMTEDIFIEDSERAGTVLADLRALGLRIALDDFGTGYSSLSYLRSFPVDILKIDRAFLSLSDDPDDALMLKAITDLGHALRLTVTAEGMETQDQCDLVAAVGCDYSQGFFYATPMAADSIALLLEGAANGGVYLPATASPPGRGAGGNGQVNDPRKPPAAAGVS